MSAPENPDPLRTSVTYLKGVGPQRAEILHKIGLWRAFDLLFYFPRDYQDMTERKECNQLVEKTVQTVAGKIEEWSTKPSRRGQMIELAVDCGTGFAKCLWFKMPFIMRDFAKGRRVLLTGRPKYDHPYWVMMHPQITYLTDAEDDEIEVEPFLPVYPLTEGLKQHHLRKIMRELLPTTDTLPLQR